MLEQGGQPHVGGRYPMAPFSLVFGVTGEVRAGSAWQSKVVGQIDGRSHGRYEVSVATLGMLKSHQTIVLAIGSMSAALSGFVCATSIMLLHHASNPISGSIVLASIQLHFATPRRSAGGLITAVSSVNPRRGPRGPGQA